MGIEARICLDKEAAWVNGFSSKKVRDKKHIRKKHCVLTVLLEATATSSRQRIGSGVLGIMMMSKLITTASG